MRSVFFDFNSAASDLHDGNDAQYRVTASGSLTNGTQAVFAPLDHASPLSTQAYFDVEVSDLASMLEKAPSSRQWC